LLHITINTHFSNPFFFILAIIYPTARQLAVSGACVGTWKHWWKCVLSTRSRRVWTLLCSWHRLSILYSQQREPRLADTLREQTHGLDLTMDFPTDTVHRSQRDEVDTLFQGRTGCPEGSTGLAQKLSFMKYNPLQIFFSGKRKRGSKLDLRTLLCTFTLDQVWFVNDTNWKVCQK